MIFMGIDGGGTKTRVVIANELGDILGIGLSGPSSLRTVTLDIMINSFNEAIDFALKGLEISYIDAIFVGLGDIESDSDRDIIKNIIKDFDICSKKTLITIESDAYNALYGGLADLNEGVSVIVGTGSVALGINKNKEIKRVGGYSYKEGDPGSSFDLGKKCITHASKVLDGRRSESDFSSELLKVLNVTNRISFVNMVDEYHNDRSKTAQLAKLVTKHAQNNSDAYDILVEGVIGVVELVNTAVIGLEIKEKNIAVIGSLGNCKEYFSLLEEMLHNLDEDYTVFKNILDPSIGAIIGGYRSMNIQIDKNMIEKLKKA